MLEVDIVDKKMDQIWLSEVLSNIWGLVKSVRRKSGPKHEIYTLFFGPTKVQITVERV